MYCNGCGNKLNIGEHFCSKCGAQVLNGQQSSNIVNNNSNISSDNQNKKKKKRKWWLMPLIIFLTAIGAFILQTILDMMLSFADIESQMYPVFNLFSFGLKSILVICWLLLLPSIIFAIIMSTKHSTGKDK